MSKELMEIGGFITEGAEIVNHDNSLSGNGTVDSPLGVVPGYNETVLYEDTSILTPTTWPGDTAPGSRYFMLTEDYKNFEQLQINFARNAALPCDGINYIDTAVMHMTNDSCVINTTFIVDNSWYNCATNLSADSAGTRITEMKGYQKELTSSPGTAYVYMHVYKVIGINRKA